jgi:NitT/TauT family transport system substrate-binding protein
MIGYGARWFAAVVLIGVLWSPAGAQTRFVVATPHAGIWDTLPIYVAQERGFFKDAGLAIDTVVVRGGGENVQAVVSGSVHVVVGTGFFAVLSAFQKGAPVKVLAAEINGLRDLYWYALGASPYRKLEDLAGKRLTFSTPGSSSHMGVLGVIAELTAKGHPAPQPLSVGGMPDALTAVKTGQAEAGFAAPPFFLDLIEKGELRIVFRGDAVKKYSDVTMRVTFAHANFVEKNPETARAFMRALQKAQDFMFDNREETVKIWIRRANLKLSESTLIKVYDFYTRESVALKPIRGIQTTMEDAVKFKFLKEPLSQAELDRLIDLSHLP